MKRTSLISALLVGALLGAPAVQAYPIMFTADLTPEAVGATGSGWVSLVLDLEADTLSIDSAWSGLSGTTTVAHIHCCTAAPFTGTVGVAVTPVTLPGFPVGVSAGSYSVMLDMSLASNYTANFLNNFGGGTVEGAQMALFNGLTSGQAYFNVHSSTFPGGEIRGFPTQVPEPFSLTLLGLGLAALGLGRRKVSVHL